MKAILLLALPVGGLLAFFELPAVAAEKSLPRKAQILYDQGVRYETSGSYEQAFQSFSAVLEQVPDSAAAQRHRGRSLLGLKKPAEALTDFEAAIKADD